MGCREKPEEGNPYVFHFGYFSGGNVRSSSGFWLEAELLGRVREGSAGDSGSNGTSSESERSAVPVPRDSDSDRISGGGEGVPGGSGGRECPGKTGPTLAGGGRRPGSPGQAVLEVHGGHNAALQVLAGPGAGAQGPPGGSRADGRGPGPSAQQQAGHHRPWKLRPRDAECGDLSGAGKSPPTSAPGRCVRQGLPPSSRRSAEPLPAPPTVSSAHSRAPPTARAPPTGPRARSVPPTARRARCHLPAQPVRVPMSRRREPETALFSFTWAR